MKSPAPVEPYDLICLSHLRWNFVFQRPQHLMTRFARDRRVYFIEEPVRVPGSVSTLAVDRSGPVTVAIPQVPEGLDATQLDTEQRRLLDELIGSEQILDFVLWYYTPMALSFSDHLAPRAIVFDCMDELSAFKGAPQELKLRDEELMRRASVVLTGGQSLYEARRHAHPNIHPFPSSVDAAHFAQARSIVTDPEDQAPIPHPRLGFYGVIDERMDLELIDGVAEARPEWHIVMIGPVVKIEERSLPRRQNVHYLGGRTYHDLPRYIAGWDVALLPFARNESTRFISPTKTPEYLAAGKPVVSTSIRDVVRPYGELGLARIADTVPDFVRACEDAMREDAAVRQHEADAFLSHTSWDRTWGGIRILLDRALTTPQHATVDTIGSAVPS